MTTTERTKDEVLSVLRQRILDNNPGLEEVAYDADLMEQGLINSLQFISFLMLIEELRAQEVPEDEVQIERFKSLNVIYDNFFVGA
jgi:acyl carrier protein